MTKFKNEFEIPKLDNNNIESLSSDSSSIDAGIDGKIGQRDDGCGDCFCNNPNYVEKK